MIEFVIWATFISLVFIGTYIHYKKPKKDYSEKQFTKNWRNVFDDDK